MRYKLILLLILLTAPGFAQSYLNYIDSIRQSIFDHSNNQDKVQSMILLSGHFSTRNYDSAVMYGNKALNLAKQINFDEGIIAALCILGVAHTRGGNLSKALEAEFKGLQLAKEKKIKAGEALCYYTIGKSYYFLKDYSNSVKYCSKARQLHLQNPDKSDGLISVYYAENDPFLDNDLVLAEAFMDNDQLDSALLYYQILYRESTDSSWKAIISIFLGDALFRYGEKNTGIDFLKKAFHLKQMEEDHYSIAWASSILARCYKELNQTDSSIYYAKVGLLSAQKVGFKDRMLKTARHLAEEYEKIDTKEAYPYLKLSTTLNDELFGQDKVFALQKTLSDVQQQQQETEKREIAFKNKIRFYLLLAGLGIILGIALLLYYNNKKEKKAKLVLENTLKKLKSTQAQLIQSEKMASLGELTAGIAHEIQNPLNFVNNFSELSSELIEEMNLEIEKGETEEVKAIAGDLKQNLEKINLHGKRASDIVKGMLEHSRKSTGEKNLTDINALCDEYLRLAYHGYRAKDKSFNADFELIADENLPKINIIPQDMGRVILNLINNAFWAVNDKKIKLGETDYKPKVIVSTQLVANSTELTAKSSLLIAIKDNGNGIPQENIDKIFQPFFTTKPTGQGTGLGLSLSYDIVKAHGGEMKVETKEGEGMPAGQAGSTFSIILPITTS